MSACLCLSSTTIIITIIIIIIIIMTIIIHIIIINKFHRRDNSAPFANCDCIVRLLCFGILLFV